MWRSEFSTLLFSVLVAVAVILQSTKDLFESVESEELITQPGILCLHIPVKDFRRTQQATKSSKLIRLSVEYRLTTMFKALGLKR